MSRTPQGADLTFAIFTASDSLRDVSTRRVTNARPVRARGTGAPKDLQQALIERWSVVHGG